MKFEQKWYRSNATPKNEVFIGLQHEYCNLVGGIIIWWVKNKHFPQGGEEGGAYYLGDFSRWGGNE